MTDTPTFHVVRVTDHLMNQLAAGTGIFLYPESTCDQGLRAILIPLGDLPAPGEMGETETGGKRVCHTVWVDSDGDVAARSRVGRTLIRRAPPEPTWQEAIKALRSYWTDSRADVTRKEAETAIEIIEKRLAGGES